MPYNLSAADRHQIRTVSTEPLEASLLCQGAMHASKEPHWNPQVQFIISNEYYERAALSAMKKAPARSAAIVGTGMGGWSLELQYDDDAAAVEVMDAYSAHCDALALD